MQILTFVTITIMVLTIITYARLEYYLDFETMKAHYASYMEKSQRSDFNYWQKKYYDTDNVSQKDSKPKPVTDATAKLSFGLILNKQKREENKQHLHHHLLLAKKLMIVLFAGQPFFKEAHKNNVVLDRLLAELMDQADAYLEMVKASGKKQDKITRLRELEKITLPTPDLDNLYYHMLQGTARDEDGAEIQASSEPPPVLDEVVEDEDDVLRSEKDGYDSFLDYITLKPGPKIRVYLAPKEILLAVFEDAATVDKIMTFRQELYNDVVNDMNADTASQAFANAFRKDIPHWLTEDMVDFTVRKTSPNSYNNKNIKKGP